MSKVFVLDTSHHPLTPCHPAVARKLLTAGKASVYRRFPFVMILHRGVEHPSVPPLRLKLDPGSKVSGLAVVNEVTGEVVFAAELEHRGQRIKDRLEARRAVRRNRRQRKTRYRKARFANRRRKAGWLPPSLESRVQNTLTWVARIRRWCPISAISLELVKFDTQLMQQAEISGVEDQQGELAGYEVRSYLLEKFHHQCVYCGKRDAPLELEHLIPKSRDGSNRVSNLAISCRPCNQRKGNRTAAEFGFPQVQAQAKAPLTDAAAVNTTRWAVYQRLAALGLPLETGSGGLTKFNRRQRGLDKSHWADAACVGLSTPERLNLTHLHPLTIKATGHGSRQMCRMDKFGFPRTSAKGAKTVHGFQTGDLVRAVVTNGKKAGRYTGRVAVRASGSFNLTTRTGTVQGISFKFCRPIHRCDGYTCV
jgi:5-methylcytosine-specific restriction endonuclease McrA